MEPNVGNSDTECGLPSDGGCPASQKRHSPGSHRTSNSGSSIGADLDIDLHRADQNNGNSSCQTQERLNTDEKNTQTELGSDISPPDAAIASSDVTDGAAVASEGILSHHENTTSGSQAEVPDDTAILGSHMPNESDSASNKDTITFSGKIFRTICANAAYLGVTLNLGLIGPSLLDLGLISGGSTSQLATVFTWRAVMGLTASLLLGPLADRINRYFLAGGALFCQAILTAFAPYCTRVIPMLVLLAIPEFFGSLIGMVTHLICANLWKKDAGPSLQSLNLMATIGYTVSPLLLKPFLAPHTPAQYDANVVEYVETGVGPEMMTLSNSTVAYGLIIPGNTSSPQTYIHYAYLTVALYDIIVSVTIFIFFCQDGCQFSIRESTQKEAEDGASGNTNPIFLVQMSLMFFAFNIFYGAVEVGYAGLLLTFVVKYLGWTKDQGTSVTALLQGSNAVVTALAVIFAKFFRPEVIVAVDITLVIITMATLSLGAGTHPSLVWICTSALGAGYATIMPSTFTWINREMALTGKFSAAYWSGFFVGFMSIPSLTGFLFENVSPMWLPYMTLLCGVAMGGMFVIINVVIYRENTMNAAAKEEVL